MLRPAQQVGIKSGRRTVWKKETRDRIKVLKMGLGDSRPLGSRALFLWATSLLFSVLANRKYLLCYNEVSFLCPRSHLPFYWLLSTVFVIFLYKGYHLTGGHRPTYALGKHLSVCTSSVLNLRWPGVPRSTLCFSLVKQGMTAPTDVLLFGLYCTAIFCFYSFPMVIFSWLSQSNRRLIINPCKLLCLWLDFQTQPSLTRTL